MADTKLVTFESVAEACEALTADEQKPSVRKVKNYLGGGSPNEILTHLREWQAGRPQVTDNVIEVSETTLNAIRRDMASAGTKAGERAEAKAAEMAETVEELQSEVTDLQRRRDALEDQIEAQAADIGGLSAENSRLVDQVRQVQAAKVEAEERLTAERNQERERAEKLAEDLATARSKLENLAGIERERDDLKAELADARDHLTEAEKRTAVAESEAKAEARRAADAEKREADTLKRLEKIEAKLDQEQAKTAQLQTDLATSKEREAQANVKINELTETGKAAQERIDALQTELADATAEAEQPTDKKGK